MFENKFFRTSLFVLLALTLLLLSGCASGAEAAGVSSVGTVSVINAVDTIETSGNLSADQLASLTWGTGGMVDKVNVEAGQSVKAGEVLAILKAESVPSDIVTAQSELASAQRDLQTLMDSDASLAAAQLAVANAASALSEAQKEVDSLYFPRASEALINNTEAQISQAKRTVAVTADRYREVQSKPDGTPAKTEAKLAWSNAQLELNTLLAKYAWYTGQPSEVEVAVAQAALESAKATLIDAQREYETLKNGPDSVDVAVAQAKVSAAQAEVNKMAIIAPFDGEILTVQTSAGSPVESGAAAIEMVNRSTLKIEAQVDETSVASVAIGNSADITMDLLPNVTLTGKVTTISSIGTTVNGLVKYTVTIALDPTAEAVRFGATANVILNISEPHAVLAVPLAAIQSDDQGEYVTLVKAEGITERIAIESGEISGGLVMITAAAGLHEGDQVQLGISSTSTSTDSTGDTNDGGLRLPGLGGPGRE